MKIRLAIAHRFVDGKLEYCAHGADNLTDEAMASLVTCRDGPEARFVEVDVPEPKVPVALRCASCGNRPFLVYDHPPTHRRVACKCGCGVFVWGSDSTEVFEKWNTLMERVR